MAASLHQQITIENVVGAGGTTAATRAMHAAPDGYTIMMGNMGTHAAAVALYPALAYDPRKDFAPVGVVTGMPVVLLVGKHLPVTSFAEFAAYARQQGAALRMAHGGIGSVGYTTCSLLDNLLSVRPTMVAYQGTSPAMNALLNGKVDYMCGQIVGIVPEARSGEIVPLAISTPERSAALPKVPTTAEAGLPSFQILAWDALFAPTGTPKPVIDKLGRALGEALDDPSTRTRLIDLGGIPPESDARSAEALRALVDREVAKWSAIGKSKDEARR
jgi:tripartite-type tricarboxylate transporter receptor subunit TctC